MALSSAERSKRYQDRKKGLIVPFGEAGVLRVQPRPCITCGVIFKPRENKTKACSVKCAKPLMNNPRMSNEERVKRKRDFSRRRRLGRLIAKIFQPVACVDCGLIFETLKPRVLVRCRECAHRRRLANHGGGPRRRCKFYGVPYEVINPLTVFERDSWVCYLCNRLIDKALIGKPNHPQAPEIDHVWPLSIKIGELKSPGHVSSNVRASHRDCNQKKRNSIVQRLFAP